MLTNRKTRGLAIMTVCILGVVLVLDDSYQYYTMKLSIQLNNLMESFKRIKQAHELPIFLTDDSYSHKLAPNCSLYNRNASQFYVNMSGIQYPLHVPLFYNKTINFECLNTLNKRNRILLWNPFFNDKTYGYGKFYFNFIQKYRKSDFFTVFDKNEKNDSFSKIT